jgi:hypothetical protein
METAHFLMMTMGLLTLFYTNLLSVICTECCHGILTVFQKQYVIAISTEKQNAHLELIYRYFKKCVCLQPYWLKIICFATILSNPK